MVDPTRAESEPLDTRLFVNVTTAAMQLGISRGLAYSLCRAYLAGQDGIPCRKFGAKRILVSHRTLTDMAECDFRDNPSSTAPGYFSEPATCISTTRAQAARK